MKEYTPLKRKYGITRSNKNNLIKQLFNGIYKGYTPPKKKSGITRSNKKSCMRGTNMRGRWKYRKGLLLACRRGRKRQYLLNLPSPELVQPYIASIETCDKLRECQKGSRQWAQKNGLARKSWQSYCKIWKAFAVSWIGMQNIEYCWKNNLFTVAEEDIYIALNRLGQKSKTSPSGRIE